MGYLSYPPNGSSACDCGRPATAVAWQTTATAVGRPRHRSARRLPSRTPRGDGSRTRHGSAVPVVMAPQCPWFAMRPQSPMAQSATRTNEMRAISYESQAQAQALQLDRVSFAYRAEDGFVLDQISLDVAAGSWVAVVGPSGSGKSTLAHLILRFWDPTSGEIRASGPKIRDYSLDDLRRLVGAV